MNDYFNRLTPNKKKELYKNAGGVTKILPSDIANIKVHFQPSSYFMNIYRFHKLIKINYPFKRDELTAWEWEDLAEFNHLIEINQRTI